MNRFWIFSAAVLIIGAGFTAFTAFENNQGIQFNDLETECRISENSNVEVRRDGDRFVFEGHYPENDTDARLNYGYSKSGKNIVLNVKSRTQTQNVEFFNGCLGSVVYDAETSSLKPGIYSIKVKHDGEEAAETSLRIPE